MATVTIAGSSFVVTSAVSMADLEAVKKYRPAALKLVDEETKEPLFKVGTGSNSLNDFSISFGGVSNDEKRLATMTLTIPTGVEDAKEYVLELAGKALMSLNKVETGIAKALEEIKTDRDTIAANIKISV